MKLIEYEKLNEKLYTGQLPNGLPVFVIPKPGFHKKYAFFAANYGGIDKRYKISDKWADTPAGVAHFLEHKMFDTVDGNALELLSANGASANAYTSTDVTAYHFECIDKFSENLEILLNFVSTPYFTQESVEKEQGIITQEINMIEDDPGFCLYYGLLRSLFKSSPLRDSVAGSVESIKKITADTLYDCHKVFYAPSNMALCVVGDIEPSGVLEMAQKILPDKPGKVPLRDYGDVEHLTPESTSVEKSMDVSLPIFIAGCKSNPPKDGQELFWIEVVSAIALEMFCGHSSPFFIKLYEEGQINADFSASFDSAANVAYTIFGGETRDPQKVYREVKDEIQRFLSQTPDIALFERIKKAAIGSHIRALNSFGVLASSVVEGHFRGFDSYQAPEILSKITIDDIINFIRNNLISENMAISVIKPLK